jgi:NADPH:quinone reductase-like Zn-dependent oxidoreductase
MQYFGLNRMDLLQRMGVYPVPPLASKTIMGVEFSGTVSKLGEGANKFKVGDEVFGLAYGVRYPTELIIGFFCADLLRAHTQSTL